MKPGLYLVTTPIGNIKDITTRAQETLDNADIIYAEDTRVLKKLLNHLGVSLEGKKITSFHDHSSEQKMMQIIEQAKNKSCAFTSDAGSPIISDPAYPLIELAYKNAVDVYSICGISSIVTALELSGLPPIPFHFHGFLARDKSKKNKDYEMIGSIYGTHIFFEGVSRIIKTVGELSDLYPEFKFCVARELTKEFESAYHFTGAEFQKGRVEITEKGEFVLLIHNHKKSEAKSSDKMTKLAVEIIEQGARPKVLSKLLSEITGQNSKNIYKLLEQAK